MGTLGIDGRRLGGGLIVFGLVGVALAGLVAVGLVLAGLSVRSLGDDLEADRLALVDTLQRTSESIGDAAAAAANVRTTLESTETVLVGTSDSLDDLAGAVDSLAGSLDFSILGQQPLAGAAEAFTGLAGRLGTFADDIDELAADLGSNQEDLDTIAGHLRDLQDRMDALADRIGAFDSTDELVAATAWGFVLLGALAAWMAVAGGFAAWVGWRLRRGAANGPGDAAVRAGGPPAAPLG